MEYTVQYREDQKIVFATAKGKWDAKTDNAMVREVMETVNTSGSLKVLLDIQELQFSFPILHLLDRAQTVKEQRQNFKNVSRKVAIVYSSEDEKIDENLTIFETLARNRGLPYRTFIDIKKAMAWLLIDE